MAAAAASPAPRLRLCAARRCDGRGPEVLRVPGVADRARGPRVPGGPHALQSLRRGPRPARVPCRPAALRVRGACTTTHHGHPGPPQCSLRLLAIGVQVGRPAEGPHGALHPPLQGGARGVPRVRRAGPPLRARHPHALAPGPGVAALGPCHAEEPAGRPRRCGHRLPAPGPHRAHYQVRAQALGPLHVHGEAVQGEVRHVQQPGGEAGH
mmetsp:Transcript_60015/g.169199  ORF Transcript_60015/g.169199 Transcript_60015/m.169199 type:complete len:210 (-) Transcript_60015:179-808(-)